MNLHLPTLVCNTVTPLNMLLGPHVKPSAAIRNLSLSQFRIQARQGTYIGDSPVDPITNMRRHGSPCALVAAIWTTLSR
jgi:hypothetical protein